MANRSLVNTGLISTTSIIILVVFFIAGVFTVPPVEYANATMFSRQYTSAQLLPLIPSFLLTLANIPLFVALFLLAEKNLKLTAMFGLIAGLAYSFFSGLNYFLQISILPGAVNGSNHAVIDLLAMTSPLSLTYALDNLGYFFLSLSFIFFGFLFKSGKLQQSIRIISWLYATLGLLGFTGYLSGNNGLENLVLLSAIPYLIVIILMMFFFKNSTVNHEQGISR